MALVPLISVTMMLCMLTNCGGPKVIKGERLQPVVIQTADKTESEDQKISARAIEAHQEGDRKIAQRLLEDEASNSPANWQAQYSLGQLSAADGEYERAMNCYQAALTFAPDDKLQRSQIYLAIAGCWERLNEPSMAKLNYMTASRLNPDSDQARDALTRLGSAPVSNK